MRVAPLKRIAAGLFSAAVLGAVPVAAWLAIGPGLVTETQASLSHGSDSFAASEPGLSALQPDGIAPVASEPVTVLDAWYYTRHDCASARGRERGRGHERHGQDERSPKDCPNPPGPPPPQRGHGR
jgi:hypothetical protein